MRKQNVAVAMVLALPFALGGYGPLDFAHAQPAPGTSAAAQYDHDHDRFHEAREQGHHDGMHAGFEDMHRGLRPDPARHHEFRHPPVDRHARDAYRDGFRHGYDEAYHHGPGGPMGGPR